MSFDQAFKDLVDIEKGFSDDPKDPGNWTGGKVNSGTLNGTMYGISAAAYPKLKIQTLSLSAAKAIYLSDYWDAVKGDALPDPVATSLFKVAVNMGPKTAIELLQKSLKAEADGTIGAITIGYATSLSAKEVVTQFLTEVAIAYTKMPGFANYGNGWLSRTIQTAFEAASVA